MTGQPVQNSQHLLDRAADLQRKGRLPEAEQLYRQILAAEPRSTRPLHLLGVMCLQQDRNAEALA